MKAHLIISKLDHEKSEQQKLEEKLAKLKQETKDENAKTQFVIKNNPLKYTPFAIPPYNPVDLPILAGNFRNRLPEIERFRRFAAKKALATDQCDRVESSDLNIKSTNKEMVFFVGCRNSAKFYFTEQELTQ